jgi:hypothetical protein
LGLGSGVRLRVGCLLSHLIVEELVFEEAHEFMGRDVVVVVLIHTAVELEREREREG